ncbi:uncharacterized protein LOC117784718 isoform X2 [Drosophila innubila]|uniref:uncharacterized protein LOC117784718 isoform X2 n=1 Tax=Drosophila innubila TaxID=198719 RepID=UPI00148C3423|nr:uncharacterized protein LOC117784718 isoform X2 [Drosophila innubila]
MNSCSDSSNDSMDANVNHVASGQHTGLHMTFGDGSAGTTSASQERYVWEMRRRSPNVTPASTVLNSPDMNAELEYSSMHHQTFKQRSPPHQLPGYLGTQQHHSEYYYQRPHPHQIRVGHSPGSSQFEPEGGLASPGSPTDVGKADGHCLRDGEIVVFDDIDTNWMNKPAALAPSDRENSEDILKVTKMIGQLPIAEYEGSPRRFGNQQMSAKGAGFPKRPPGFPQRVSPITHRPNNNNVIGSMADKTSVGNLIDLIDHEGTNATGSSKTPTFDYLYEFSETRKVLEEFFKANPDDEQRFTDFTTESGDDVASSDMQPRVCEIDKHIEQAYIGQRLARIPKDELYIVHRSSRIQSSEHNTYQEHNDIELYIDSNSRSSGDLADTEMEANLRRHSRNFTLSPETTDYDSNCGDMDSLSNDINCATTDYGKLYTSMPVLEDGLSSGHASDTENNVSVVCDKQQQPQQQQQLQQQQKITNEHEHNGNSDCERLPNEYNSASLVSAAATDALQSNDFATAALPTPQLLSASPTATPTPPPHTEDAQMALNVVNADSHSPVETYYDPVYAAGAESKTKLSSSSAVVSGTSPRKIQETMMEIRSALQRAKTQPEKLKICDEILAVDPDSPVWVPRKNASATRLEEDEADTDLETDRLLGQQDFFAEQTRELSVAADSNANGLANNNANNVNGSDNNSNSKAQGYSTATIRQGIGTSLTPNSPDICQIVDDMNVTLSSPEKLQYSKSPTGSIKSFKDSANIDKKAKSRNKEGT